MRHTNSLAVENKGNNHSKDFLIGFNTIKPHKTLDWLAPYKYLYRFYCALEFSIYYKTSFSFSIILEISHCFL